jgi:hypothetical protein
MPGSISAMTNTFEAVKWEEQPYAESEGGTKLAHAKMTYVYTGQLEGESNASGLLTYLPDGTGTFIGSELFTGTIDGKKGTVVLQQSGTFDAEGVAATWHIAPGSGTGELTEAGGKGEYGMKMGTMSTAYTFTS